MGSWQPSVCLGRGGVMQPWIVVTENDTEKFIHTNSSRAIMFTLLIGDEVFAFWRQSLWRDQNIFCLNNIPANPPEVDLNTLNRVTIVRWLDLVSGMASAQGQMSLTLAPCQSVWPVNTFQ